MNHIKTIALATIATATLTLSSGCANGTGKAIVRGAAQGATHGAINKHVDGPVAEGAAHGALASGAAESRKNRAARKATPAEEK